MKRSHKEDSRLYDLRCTICCAVLGACLNVKINAAGLKDRAVADAEKAEREILEIVESKIK